MEAAAAATTILALLSSTSTLLGYIRDIKNAGKDLEELREELSTLYSLLYLVTNLQASPDHSTAMQDILHVLGIKHGPLDEYSRVLEELCRKVQKRNPVLSALSLLITKGEVKEMLEKIERLKSTITLHLNVSGIIALDELGRQSIEFQYQGRLQEALKWLSMVDARGYQEFLLPSLEKDTGNWFLHSPEFTEWLENPKTRMIFCPGMPGAGKTMMTARVVQCLQSAVYRDPTKGKNLAFLYCDYKNDRIRPVSMFLGEILKQLVENNEKELWRTLLAFHDDHVEKKTRPTEEELYEILRAIVSRQRVVYLVIDAVDELPQLGKRRWILLDFLAKLQSETTSVKLMITSRFVPDVLKRFSRCLTLEIRAKPEDIKLYIAGQFDTFKATLNDGLRDRVTDCILKVTNGMFLLARLLVARFADLYTPKEIKVMISNLSAHHRQNTETTAPLDVYGEMYRNTMKRIEEQGERDANLARRVIQWITYTARLLTIDELCCALSVELNTEAFDPDNWYSLELVTSVCAGLVVADKARNVIRLVHHTAQEFFESTLEGQRPAIHKELCLTFLTYLCYSEFRPKVASGEPTTGKEQAEDSGPPFEIKPGWMVHHSYGSDSRTGEPYAPSYDEFHSSQVRSVQVSERGWGSTEDKAGSVGNHHCLLDYAANFWATHAKWCEREKAVLRQAMLLPGDQQLAAHAFRAATSLYEPWPFLWFGSGTINTRATGLHLLAALGLRDLCAELLTVIDRTPDIHADAKDDGRRTALMWAAHHGHLDIVKLLLARSDVKSDKQCSRGDTALSYAARQGWASIVEFLLQDEQIRSHAARENSFGETALVQAALEGHEAVVKVLSRWDERSIHREVMFGMWPVHIAAQRRPASTFRFLVEKCGVDTNVKDPKGCTPFMVAVDWGNEDVVRYFLEERKIQLMEEKREEIFAAAKLAAANWRRLGILQRIVEAARFVLTFRSSTGDEVHRRVLEGRERTEAIVIDGTMWSRNENGMWTDKKMDRGSWGWKREEKDPALQHAGTLLEAAVDAANFEGAIYISAQTLEASNRLLDIPDRTAS